MTNTESTWTERAAAMTDAQLLHHWEIAKAVNHTESADAIAAEWTRREAAKATR